MKKYFRNRVISFLVLCLSFLDANGVEIPEEFKELWSSLPKRDLDKSTINDAIFKLTENGVRLKVFNRILEGNDGMYVYVGPKKSIESLTLDSLRERVPGKFEIDTGDHFEVSVVLPGGEKVLEWPKFKERKSIEISKDMAFENILKELVSIFEIPIKLNWLTNFSKQSIESDLTVSESNIIEALDQILPLLGVQSYKFDVYVEGERVVYGLLRCY